MWCTLCAQGCSLKFCLHCILLGINIDFILRFDEHVSEICKTDSKQYVFLKRLGRFLTKQGKMTIYNSFIVSNFYYCPLAWHFCRASSTNKIEKI